MNRDSITPFSFIIEALNPPMRHSMDRTNRLFSELKDVYANCTRPADNITEFFMRDAASEDEKTCTILGDKVVISNINMKCGLDAFWETSSFVLGRVVSLLQIPLFFFRQYTVRLLATPKDEEDSRIFLGGKVCGFQDDKLKLLGRPIHGCGIRFIFPPIGDNQSEYIVRIESLLKDTKKVYIENRARFLAPLQLGDDFTRLIKHELVLTYKFLEENIATFLMEYNE